MVNKIFFSMLSFFVLAFGMAFIASYAIISAGIAFGVIDRGVIKDVVVWIFILMPIVFALTVYLATRIHNKLLSALNIFSSMWIVILIYLFMAAVALSIYFWIGGSLGYYIDSLPASWVALGLVAVLLLYGILNATKLRLKNYEVSSSALANVWKDKKIVLVSDIHIGIIRGKKFLEKVVAKINAQNPEIVFIAGDIIDGPVFDYDNGLAQLKNLKAPLGVFYTPGNHEKYNSEQVKFLEVMRGLVNVVIDEKKEINSTQIVGLDYKQESPQATKDRLMKTGYDRSKPSIIMLHDPKNTSALVEQGASLILSGHTHRGQFFPITLLIKMMYKNLGYGLNIFGPTTSITSAGAGTSVSPFRLGTNPEIVTINII